MEEKQDYISRNPERNKNRKWMEECKEMSKRIGDFKEELEEMDKKIEELEAQNDAKSRQIIEQSKHLSISLFCI